MTQFTLNQYSDPKQFASLVTPFLLQHEAVHCLQLGLLGAMARGDWQDRYLGAVEQDGSAILVAMRTPPHPLILSHTGVPESLQLLVDELQRLDPAGLPSEVMGPAPVVAEFKDRWSASNGWSARPSASERIYQLDDVIPVAGVPGEPRRATRTEFDLLVDWYAAFYREAVAGEPVNVAASVDRRLSSTDLGGLWLWLDGSRPVSLAGAGNPTLHGARIGPVYTPPEERKKGYASALTAYVSRQLLDSGRTFCYLFTDLNNPTSNHIYQQIGYQPVADINKFALSSPLMKE